MIESIWHVCSNTSRKVWTNRKNGSVWIQLTTVCVLHSISCLAGRSFNLSVFLSYWIGNTDEKCFLPVTNDVLLKPFHEHEHYKIRKP